MEYVVKVDGEAVKTFKFATPSTISLAFNRYCERSKFFEKIEDAKSLTGVSFKNRKGEVMSVHAV